MAQGNTPVIDYLSKEKSNSSSSDPILSTSEIYSGIYRVKREETLKHNNP